MINVVLKSTLVYSRESFYDEFQKQIDLPDYFSRNLDALWDSLTDILIDENIDIQWHDFTSSKASLGDYADKIIDTFKDLEEEFKRFTYQIL